MTDSALAQKRMSTWLLADDQATLFPLENLPYGVFVHPMSKEHHCCTIVGDTIVDLHILSKHTPQHTDIWPEALHALIGQSLEEPTWNTFMSKGPIVWKALRQHLQYLLSAQNATLQSNSTACNVLLLPNASSTIQMVLPATVGDYTDFYSSKEHATNLGKMFRPDSEPLLPNWLWMPVGYHGRASSIVVSGTPIFRPEGQSRAPDPTNTTIPTFGPSTRVDMEVEVAAWIGVGNTLGEPIVEGKALEHVFGLSIFNDWSARDIQPWEYVPLGPFLAKNFASTISPWIVSLDALQPFFLPAPVQDPAPLNYLKRTREDVAIDIALSADFKLASGTSKRITHTNYKSMYWSLSQQIAHHTVGGCNLRPGDILASGTISGTDVNSWGSLIELTNRGQTKIEFSSGETRTFVQDGDSIVMTATASNAAVPYQIGFGEASGTLCTRKKA